LGGIEWGFAADEQNVYVPVADVFGAARKPGITALRTATGEKRWHVPAPLRNRLGNRAMQQLSIGSRDRHSGGGFFRHRGRAPARLPDQGRYDHLELRHGPADSNCERRSDKGRRSGWRRADNRNGILYTNSGYGRIVDSPAICCWLSRSTASDHSARYFQKSLATAQAVKTLFDYRNSVFSHSHPVGNRGVNEKELDQAP